MTCKCKGLMKHLIFWKLEHFGCHKFQDSIQIKWCHSVTLLIKISQMYARLDSLIVLWYNQPGTNLKIFVQINFVIFEFEIDKC